MKLNKLQKKIGISFKDDKLLIQALTHKIEVLLVDNENEEKDTVSEAVKSVTKLLEIAERLPKMADIISNLEDRVKKEQGGESKIRGGGIKGMFED